MDIYKLIEWIKFSPVGYSVTGLGSYSFFDGLQKFSEGNNIEGLVSAISGTLLTCAGIGTLIQHIRGKEKLENAFKKYGYHERLVKPYLSKWCNRNLAKIIVKKYGFSNEFKQTIKMEKNKRRK